MRPLISAVLLMILVLPGRASAQFSHISMGVEVPPVDLAVGLRFTYPTRSGSEEAGIVAAAARNFSEWFGVAGEVASSYRRQVVRTDARSSRMETIHAGTTLVAGPRIATPYINDSGGTEPMDVRFFFQLLGGTVVGDPASSWIVQPGVGVDVNTWTNLKVRLQWDYRHLRRAATDLSGPRLAVSVVVPIGSRE